MFSSDTLSRSFRPSMSSFAIEEGTRSSAAAGVTCCARGVDAGSVPVASRWINSDTERGFVRGIPGGLSAIRGNDCTCGAQECDGNGGGGIEPGGEVDQLVLSKAEDGFRKPSTIMLEDTVNDGVDFT